MHEMLYEKIRRKWDFVMQQKPGLLLLKALSAILSRDEAEIPMEVESQNISEFKYSLVTSVGSK
jgi:hypothetical protein